MSCMTARKRVPFQNFVLRVAAGAGVVTVSILAPKMMRLLKEFDRPSRNRKQLYERLSQALGRMERAGLIKFSSERRKIELTEKGRSRAEEFEFEQFIIPKPVFWDGKWRVVFFDLAERRRSVRTRLRNMLNNAGFVRLQDSVWVYPHPCDEFIALARTHLKIGVSEMRSLVAEALESDAALRNHFRL